MNTRKVPRTSNFHLAHTTINNTVAKSTLSYWAFIQCIKQGTTVKSRQNVLPVTQTRKGMADVTSSDQVAEMVKCSRPPHTYLHREPFFIIFNMLSYLVWRQICFNKSVTHATGRWEVWNVTIESRLLVPFASSPGIWFETCVIKRLCESFWFHNLFVKFHTGRKGR